jgi:hypothetical protein
MSRRSQSSCEEALENGSGVITGAGRLNQLSNKKKRRNVEDEQSLVSVNVSLGSGAFFLPKPSFLFDSV